MQTLANGRGLERADPSWQMMQAARTSGSSMEAMLAGVLALCSCLCSLHFQLLLEQ